jgi:hypothetical protein
VPPFEEVQAVEALGCTEMHPPPYECNTIGDIAPEEKNSIILDNEDSPFYLLHRKEKICCTKGTDGEPLC